MNYKLGRAVGSGDLNVLWKVDYMVFGWGKHVKECLAEVDTGEGESNTLHPAGNRGGTPGNPTGRCGRLYQCLQFPKRTTSRGNKGRHPVWGVRKSVLSP